MAASERPPTQSGGPPGCAGTGLDLDVLEGEELTRERAAAGEQRSQRAHRLVRPRAALAHRHADRLEVLLPLAAYADAEDHPAARHVVERRELLRDDARVPQRQQHHAGADRDPLRDGGERRQRDDDVEDRVAVRDVVARPDRVVAERLRRAARALGRRPDPARRPTCCPLPWMPKATFTCGRRCPAMPARSTAAGSRGARASALRQPAPRRTRSPLRSLDGGR